MKYVHTKDLQNGVSDLYRRGGKYQRAAKSVKEILGNIANSDENPFHGYKTTNYGEKRLNHCVKYDLTGACRLVTVVNAGITFLLFVGTHTDVDKWLDKSRGKEFAVDDSNKLVETLRPAEVRGEGTSEPVPERDVEGESSLLERLNSEFADVLLEPLSFKAGRALNDLTVFSTDDEINVACTQIGDESLADAALDVLIALAGGNIKEAEVRIRLFQGEYLELEDASEVDGGQNLQFVPTDSPAWAKLYEHFAKTAGYKDWMLFLHPDQEGVVERDFNGSAKLLGVSGSGKTCVVVKRALRLAQKYPSEQVLVLTLNRSLAKLIDDLMDEAAPEDLRPQIEVKPFFEVCQQLIYQFEPGSERYYSDVTWHSKGRVDEHIDAVWREFYRCDLNNFDAALMQPVHDSLLAQSVNAEDYLREEFDWIRSAIAHNERSAYFELTRKGRSFPLQKQQRELLLEGLVAWEKKMRDVGVIDGLGLVAALQPHLHRIKPRYRSILVDESQDFGTSELDIIRRLVEPDENDLFICGDAAQQVSSKYQKLSEANISIPSARSLRIEKNYRNSREILTAANQVLVKHINEFHMDGDEFEVLTPEYADFSGSTPLLLKADNLLDEIGSAYHFLKEETKENPSWKGCIAIAGYSLYEIQQFGKRNDLPVLDGTRSVSDEAIYLSDLAQTKGFEFDVMLVVNVREGVMPNPLKPELERAQDLAQLYVAMTRAKSQLILSYHKTLSPLLEDMDDIFLGDDWSSYNDGNVAQLGEPPLLSELNDDTQVPDNIAEMDGPQFLYTTHAIGLSQRLIGNIRAKIGRSDASKGRLTVSVDMGYSHALILSDAKSRNAFGSESAGDLKILGGNIGLAKLHAKRLAGEETV